MTTSIFASRSSLSGGTSRQAANYMPTVRCGGRAAQCARMPHRGATTGRCSVKKLLAAALICSASIFGTATWMEAQHLKGTVATNDFVELQRLIWKNHQGYD